MTTLYTTAMSKTVAKLIESMIGAATLPLSPRQREKTVARIVFDLDRKGTRIIESPRGALQFHAARGAGAASSVERFHRDEPETLEWIDTHIKSGETLWDIGANIGLYSLYAGLKRDVTVFAFEPYALNFSLLVEHIRLNDRGNNIKPLCIALGKETKIDALNIKEFSVGQASNALGVSENQFGAFRADFTQAVPAFMADDFCRIFNIAPPDHIKLDVDGIEGDILAGMSGILPRVKSLTIEVEGWNADHVAAAIDAPLNRAGLKENESHRQKGSRRNRLYTR